MSSPQSPQLLGCAWKEPKFVPWYVILVWKLANFSKLYRCRLEPKVSYAKKTKTLHRILFLGFICGNLRYLQLLDSKKHIFELIFLQIHPPPLWQNFFFKLNWQLFQSCIGTTWIQKCLIPKLTKILHRIRFLGICSYWTTKNTF